MSFKGNVGFTGYLGLGFLVLSLGTGLDLSDAYASGGAKAFDGAAEFIFKETQAGAAIVRRLTGMSTERVSDVGYRSFLERIRWERTEPLRKELDLRLTKITTDFSDYRVAQKRASKLTEGEVLLPDERIFLVNASEALRGSERIETLMDEALIYVDAFVGPHPRKGNFEANARAFRDDANPGNFTMAFESPLAAFGANGKVDIRKLEKGWLSGWLMTGRDYVGMLKSFIFSEGSWRSLFTKSGKVFTTEDVLKLRKYNRLLDGLSPYAEMRLMIRAFANEPAAVYTYLNSRTAEITRNFSEGFMSIDAYVAARKAAAEGLPLNKIIWEAETKMLTVLERCRALGGHMNGTQLENGAIRFAEEQVLRSQGQIKRLEALIAESRKSGDKRNLLRDVADRDLWTERLNLALKDLRSMYLEFVTNRSELDIFANLRYGRINGEATAAFDMADPFAVSQEQINAWAEIFDRALYNSTNALVINESKLFFSTRVGHTRKFVREMNELTGTFVGKKFTETALGREFEEYNQHIAVVAVVRLGKLLGVVVPAAVAKQIGEHWVLKLWNKKASAQPNDKSEPGSDE